MESVMTGVAAKHYFIYFLERCDCRDNSIEKLGYIYKKKMERTMLLLEK